MQELKEWAQVICLALLGTLIIMLITAFIMFVIYPQAIETGITIGEHL